MTFRTEQAEVENQMEPGVLLMALCAAGAGVVAVKVLFPVGVGLSVVGCVHALCAHLCVWMRLWVCVFGHVYLCVFACVHQSVDNSGAISPGS